MNDALLVRVLHGLANLNEQLQPLRGRELGLIAVLRQGDAVDQFHHEVGPARVGRAGVEDVGDVRVIHQGQSLTFGLKAGDNGAGIHAWLDDLQRHFASHRFALLGHVNDTEAAFADLLQQLVAADLRTRALEGRRIERGVGWRRATEKVARSFHRVQQVVDLRAKRLVVGASLLQVLGPLVIRAELQCPAKDRLHVFPGFRHSTAPRNVSTIQCDFEPPSLPRKCRKQIRRAEFVPPERTKVRSTTKTRS